MEGSHWPERSRWLRPLRNLHFHLILFCFVSSLARSTLKKRTGKKEEESGGGACGSAPSTAQVQSSSPQQAHCSFNCEAQWVICTVFRVQLDRKIVVANCGEIELIGQEMASYTLRINANSGHHHHHQMANLLSNDYLSVNPYFERFSNAYNPCDVSDKINFYNNSAPPPPPPPPQPKNVETSAAATDFFLPYLPPHQQQ